MSGPENIGDEGFDEELPSDQFDDDDEFGEVEEIDEAERQALHQDLRDVKVLKQVLGGRGIRGVVVYCPDCESDHYLGWDLLAGNLEQILSAGRPPVHEPAWEPDPDEYASWDYARGFLDGFEAYPEEASSGQACAYCGSSLPEGGYEWSHCPSCGADLAPVNLMRNLRDRGWEEPQIKELMADSGFDPPLLDVDQLFSDLEKGDDGEPNIG